MTKYNLTNEEKDIVNKFRKFSIPYIFKSGKYCGYMQFFESIDFDVCLALLKGKNIDRKIYNIIVSEGTEIKKEDLDKNALEFYNLYLTIEKLVKKYCQISE